MQRCRSSDLAYVFACFPQAAEQREVATPGSARRLLQAYAGLAVLRQSGLLLWHYGVRCAHLYMRHSMVGPSL